MNPADQEWWSTYFDEVFLRIYRPLLGPERTAMEVDSIVEMLGLSPPAQILDVGCGWGRHAIELASHGFAVTGIDLSPLLLRQAEMDAARAGASVRWIQGDMRRLDFHGEFEAAVSLFSSMGYFLDDADDLRVLSGIRKAVAPGGLFLLETMHRDMIAREYLERDWWETPEGDHVWVERQFDPIAGTSHELLRWRDRTGAEGEKPHSIRIRSASEWADLLERSGWRPIEWIGGWDLEPFTHLSSRLMVVAEVA